MNSPHPKTAAAWGFAVALWLLILTNGFFYFGHRSLFMFVAATLLSLSLLGIGYYLLHREIIDRRRAEHFLSSIIDNIPHMVAVKDAESLRFTLLNKAGEALMGVSQDQAIGRTDEKITSSVPGQSAPDEQVLDGGKPVDIAAETLASQDLGLRTLHTKKIPIIDEGGLPLYLLMISEDITERRQAERHLATQYAVARVLTTADSLEEVAPQVLQIVCENLEWELGALWHIDRESNELRCTDLWHVPTLRSEDFDAATRALPYTLGQGLPGKVWATRRPSWVVRSADVPAYPRAKAVEKAGLSTAFACPIMLGSDVSGVIEMYSKTVQEPNNELLEMMRTVASQLGQFVERKKAEQQLKQARDAALESARFKSEFMANMSHEIRTPMNAIIGMTDLLMGTGLQGRQKEFVEVVHRSGESLLQIINDILDFSKIEAGKFIFETIDFQVHEPIEQVARMLAGRAQSKGVELAVFIHPDVPRVLSGDPSRLSQVITNLVGNAVKFTEHGEVLVDVRMLEETESMVRLSFKVKDTGVGISEEAQQRLFQAFTQADGSTTRKFGGTGLGLAISRRLVELMGGEIQFVSRLGEGSTFTFSIPFKRAQSVEQAATTGSTEHLSGLRVLVVDDNDTNRHILRLQTAGWGMNTDCASSATEALVALREAAQDGRPYAIAFLDLQMPNVNGLELATAIRADSTCGSVKTIILSSMGRILTNEELDMAGVSGCLTKPIRQSDLWEGVMRVLGRGPLANNGKISLGLVLHTEAARSERMVTEHVPPMDPSEARLLLAEDNAVNRSVAKFQLSKLGYHVTMVENGRQAVDVSQKRDFDLILMDCQMPEMDGYRASVEIRWQEGGKRRIPIIAMTANALEGDRELCLSAGMDDYLSKPVKTKELKAMLEKWLPRASAIPDGPVDIERLHELTNHDETALRRLVAIYFKETVHELEILEKAVQGHDTNEARRMAHGCAGASASYGMTAIVIPLKHLEQAVLADDWVEAAKLFKDVRTAYHTIVERMLPYLPENAGEKYAA